MSNNKNIESFNNVVSYAMAKAYDVFPCHAKIYINDLEPIITYICEDTISNNAYRDFTIETLRWLEEEIGLITLNEDIQSTVSVKLTLKGLQHLRAIPKSVKEKLSLGDIFKKILSRRTTKGILSGVENATAFAIDKLLNLEGK